MEKHIVIIEDDPHMLRGMSLILTKAGYKVTPLTALSTFEELMVLNADLFILDERLPFVNGHIICLMLKANPVTKETPVILTSAYNELANLAMVSKADAFLPKPFMHISDLLNLVSSMFYPVTAQAS